MSLAQDDAPGPLDGAGALVLLVDRDVEAARSLRTLLVAEAGLRVDLCHDEADALQRLAGGQVPDLVVLTQRLGPEDPVFQTCRELRGMWTVGQVPVLMRVACADDVGRAVEVDASDFVIADAPQAALLARVRLVLRAAALQRHLREAQGRLSRAMDLARMGPLEWRPVPGEPFWQGLNLPPQTRRLMGLRTRHPMGWVLGLYRMMAFADRQKLSRRLRELGQSPGAALTHELRLLGVLRHPLVLRLELEPVHGPDGQPTPGCTGIVQDITERRNTEHHIRRLAYRDPLTELPNRRQLHTRIEAALAAAAVRGHLVGLILIDLDHFKRINDHLGHAQGDMLLWEVGLRLRSCVRHIDDIVESAPQIPALAVEGPAGRGRLHRRLECAARLGGDEFAVLLPDIASAVALERIAARIQHSLGEPCLLSMQEVFPKASLGVAMSPVHGTSVDGLMRAADLALYAAKSRGRNQTVLYRPDLDLRAHNRLAREAALHKALERGELLLQYQPKVDTRRHRVIGLEALMRWRQGDAVVGPGDFIAMAEEADLIVSFSEWALHETARQIARWQADFGFCGTVSVNLPTRMFSQTHLPQRVAAAAAAAGIPVGRLAVEVTESSLMKDIEVALPVLQRLSDMGVQIAVDDFGTGYSSLHYLTELPISELKVDRSFVVNMVRKSKAEEVVRLIVSLGHAMRLRVVAEGVEELGQLARLRALGCDLVQGYLFGQPMAGDRFEGWLRSQGLSVATLQEPQDGSARG